MRANFTQKHVAPQSFYIKVEEDNHLQLVTDCINLSKKDASKLALYHNAIDQLCAENGFLYKTIADGSCPKYLASEGEYVYKAHNYFIDDNAMIFHCEASLHLENDQPKSLILDFYDGDIHLQEKTRRIDLDKFADKALKSESKEEFLDIVSYIFADGIMHLHCESVMWGSWVYDAQRSTAFPTHIQYNTALLEQVIIPKYVLAPIKTTYNNISRPVVVSSSGLGREATITVAFLADGTLKEGVVQLTSYIEEEHKVLATRYTKDPAKEILESETQPMTPWQAMID